MVMTKSQKAARARWRSKLRMQGRSWRCIIAEHDDCRGRIGRLRPMKRGEVRSECTCPCHQQQAATAPMDDGVFA